MSAPCDRSSSIVVPTGHMLKVAGSTGLLLLCRHTFMSLPLPAARWYMLRYAHASFSSDCSKLPVMDVISLKVFVRHAPGAVSYPQRDCLPWKRKSSHHVVLCEHRTWLGSYTLVLRTLAECGEKNLKLEPHKRAACHGNQAL